MLFLQVPGMLRTEIRLSSSFFFLRVFPPLLVRLGHRCAARLGFPWSWYCGTGRYCRLGCSSFSSSREGLEIGVSDLKDSEAVAYIDF